MIASLELEATSPDEEIVWANRGKGKTQLFISREDVKLEMVGVPLQVSCVLTLSLSLRLPQPQPVDAGSEYSYLQEGYVPYSQVSSCF